MQASIDSPRALVKEARPDVAFYVQSLEGGGAERVLVNLANSMARDGARVDVVLVKAIGPYLSQLSAEVRLIDLKSRGSMASILSLRNYLRRERPKCLVASMENACISAGFATRLSQTDVRLFMWEHTTPSVHLMHTKSKKEKIMPPFCRATYPRAEKVIAVSEGCAADVSKLYRVPRSQIVTIYPPIQIDEIRKLALEHAEHPWFGDKDHPLLLGVGRLMGQKDYPNMIRAFAEVRKTRDARLIILGEGTLEGDLRALATALGVIDHIDFHGYVKNPYAYMARVDLLVLSSLYEALPAVLVESIASGTGVVSTNCPSGPDEILDDGKYGVLVPVASPGALAAGILDALDHPRPLIPDERLAIYRSDFIAQQFRDLLLSPRSEGA